jgi:hypothetical protein
MDTIRSIQTVVGPTLTVAMPAEFNGQRVEVHVRVLPAAQPWGDGLRRCAGALESEWSDEDDRILAEIHQDRDRDTRREIAG